MPILRGEARSKALNLTFSDLRGETIQKDSVTAIWRAFGAYIAKQIGVGKGVGVPKFGNFNFSAVHVDLAGTTNPGQRDQQLREPIFLIGKDFIPGSNIRKGICNAQGVMRPNDV